MAFSGTQKTRLGVGGFSRGLYGSFAGKSAAVGGVISLIGPGGLVGPGGLLGPNGGLVS